ncbi:hypothetical protein acdb102_25900 [Acidothermaceae bacterium B102]|nr:hypothetical protein acdb102_25900 [Acidothermaceae bacterium B102]
MSTDLRALLRDLAEDAPPIDNRIALADTSYAAGRRRRTLRRFEFTSAAAVVVLTALFAGLFLGSAPLAARYGSSGGTSVSGYPTHIGRQFPVLPLPAKPGPIAGLLAAGDHWWAVSPNGHRWSVPEMTSSSADPVVSADGRMLGYLRGQFGPYVIRDLVSGHTKTVANFSSAMGASGDRYQVALQTPGFFSADDRLLALNGWVRDGQAVLVVDATAGTVTRTFSTQAFAVGWAGTSVVTLDTASRTATELPPSVGATSPVVLAGSGAMTGGQTAGVVNADGSTVVTLAGGEFDNPGTLQRAAFYDLTTGQLRAPTHVVPPAAVCSYTAGRDLVYTRRGAGDSVTAVARVADTGLVSTATRLDPALGAGCGIWAAKAFDGAARSPLLLDRASALLLGSLTEVVWGASILLLLGVLLWLIRVSARSHDRQAPNAARERRRWSTRRRVTTVVVVLVCTSLAMVVLAYTVLVPLATGDLVSTQSPLWLSAVDASNAKAGAAQGAPATVVEQRPGQQQGFLVRLNNPTDRAQTIIGGDPSATVPAIAVSTTDGTEAQARGLTYRRSGTIPAHEYRWVRQLQTSMSCINLSGGSMSTSTLIVRVQIGWTQRSVTIALSPVLEIASLTTVGPGQTKC